jgi:hypothetical protein
VKGSGRGLLYGTVSAFFSQELRKITNFSWNNRSPGRSLMSGPMFAKSLSAKICNYTIAIYYYYYDVKYKYDFD